MPFIFSLLTGALGKYLLIGVAALAFMTWIRHDAAAPYKREVVALREAAARKEAIIKADAARAEADSSEIARLQATVESIAHESRLATGSCQLSPVERDRLQQLAAGNR